MGDAALSLEFWGRCAVGRDSDSILWGDQNWRDDWSLTRFALRQIDAPSLSDGEGAGRFYFPDYSVDFPGDSDRDFDSTLWVDRLASDLTPIPDSDSPRGPALMVGDSVLGRAFGARDEVQGQGDVYLADAGFQNIYLWEVAVWRE